MPNALPRRTPAPKEIQVERITGVPYYDGLITHSVGFRRLLLPNDTGNVAIDDERGEFLFERIIPKSDG